MRQLKLSKAFTLMESGPVVLVTTHDGEKDNIMTISWPPTPIPDARRSARFTRWAMERSSSTGARSTGGR